MNATPADPQSTPIRTRATQGKIPPATGLDVIEASTEGQAAGYATGWQHGYSQGYTDAQRDIEERRIAAQAAQAGVTALDVVKAREKAAARARQIAEEWTA